MKDKKQRFDTAAGQKDLMDAATTEILPPEHCFMRKRDMPFWRSIISARDAKSWTQADLENAANLARCKADIERIQEELEFEGDVTTNARGTLVANPKHGILETLSRRAMALSAKLHVHAEATSGRSGDERKRNKAASDARETYESVEDDDLIAKPPASLN